MQDWVDVVSNFTMGMVLGAIASFIGYCEVAQETGSKFVLQNSPTMQRDENNMISNQAVRKCLKTWAPYNFRMGVVCVSEG